MIRAVVWKEFRDQGLIGLTLVVLGAGILAAAAALGDPPAPAANPTDVLRFLGVGRLATLLLAVTAGMVCGGALFAAEREAGTIGFLESLPASRWQVWRAKVAAGVLLAAFQIVVLVLVALALGLVGTPGWALAVVIYSLLAFVWGAYGSTVTSTTLGSVGVAIPAATLAAVLFLVPIMLFFAAPGASMPRPTGALLFLVLMFVTPVSMSALAFTRPDRDREGDDSPGPVRSIPLANRDAAPPPARAARPRRGIKALVWLATRQAIRPGLVLSAFAVVFGLVLLLPTVQPYLFWLPVSLAAGVLAGVTAFGDEQTRDTARFWGERRLPVGRAWVVKVGTHFLLALWLLALVALPSFIRYQASSGVGYVRANTLSAGVFQSLLPDQLGVQGWKYLFVPVVYGFVAGHLCGLLFRKLVVAAGVAMLVGGTAAALWVPSLLAGGLHYWQVWVPPAIALITARLLIRPWAADRLTVRGPLTTLAAGLAAAVLAMAVGIGYRVVEVPNNPTGEADVEYIARMPEVDANSNSAGREFRTAAERFARVQDRVNPDFEKLITQPTSTRRQRMEDRTDGVLFRGWVKEDEEFGQWLDRLYDDRPVGPDDRPWPVLAADATARPVGMYEDPRLISGVGSNAAMENARRMALVMLARGLQQQALGDPAPMAANLRTCLALTRNLRNGSVIPSLMLGNFIERSTLHAADRWLEKLPPRADLLRVAVGAMVETDNPAPFDPTLHALAERHVVRELMKAPNQWLPDYLTLAGESKDRTNPEVDLIAFAWTVPWERERTRRLVGLGLETASRPVAVPLIRGRPGSGFLLGRNVSYDDLTEYDRIIRVFRRGVLLKLAVRLYEAEKGSPPPTAAALVAAGYLPAVPIDPYDGQPFRFRVSAGETLQPPARLPVAPGFGRPFDDVGPPQKVAPGQVVVWSVGMNRTDEGGRQIPTVPGFPPRTDDLVFLVPLPAPSGL